MIKGKTGLSSETVRVRRKQFGDNILPEEKTVPAIRLFLRQFINPLVYILLLAGLVSLFLGKFMDFFLILAVVVVNAIMGFFQENKTQKTLAALKKLVKPMAQVLRDNEKKEIEAKELVPDDIVYLSTGDRIPADGKILESITLLVSEAILTGESEAIKKMEGDDVFMGTIVASGRAVMQVEKTGLSTKIGEIAKTIKVTEQPETTLQLRLKQITKTLIYVSVFLSILVFSFGIFSGHAFWEMLELSAILLVAVIPEALLIVITLILVLAMRESLKKKALIRKILAVETLGSVTTICTDKTGTLTEGKMRVVKTDFTDIHDSFLVMCLCNDMANTVEIAFWNYLNSQENFDPKKTFEERERIFEIPFGSEHKFMVTANTFPAESDNCLVVAKGAPEVILGISNLDEASRKYWMEKINDWATEGLKVLALAHKTIRKDAVREIKKNYLAGFEWLGLVGLWDPPRQEVRETLKIASCSGLKIKIVTGDFHQTALKVMDYLGIKIRPDQILVGDDLEKMQEDEMRKKVPEALLFARVTPEQKLRIIKVLQENGEIIAMTGDGVNDAPALKKSNIGIVVGDATEVAKETADLILLDNNFKTIVSAIESGRLVFENIKKIVLFILSNSFAEVVLILGALFLGWPFPLTVVQILWLHLLCDGPEDFILGFEPKEKETMLEGPKNIKESIIGRYGLAMIAVISILSGLMALGFFWFFGIYRQNLDLGRTVAFMALAFASVIYIFSFRTLRKPFWCYENFWSNKGLFAVVLFSLSLAIVITYFPPTQKILNLSPLGYNHWMLLLANALILTMIIELFKLLINIKRSKEI